MNVDYWWACYRVDVLTDFLMLGVMFYCTATNGLTQLDENPVPNQFMINQGKHCVASRVIAINFDGIVRC